MRIVEDNLADADVMQQILALILDEERLSQSQADQQMKKVS
jgi:hypothetical protein